jgi:hypothetical protein
MRKSRQPRRTAAISFAAASDTAKLLEADRNLASTVFRGAQAAKPHRSRNHPGWHQVEQSLPAE